MGNEVPAEVSGRPLPETVDPDFGFTPANAAARTMQPLGFVVAGAECFYRQSVRDLPAYEGVDLTGCRDTGCAFCVSGGGRVPWKGSPAERALPQIAAFHRTYPATAPGARARLRLLGHEVLVAVDRIADGMRALAVPPTDLLLDARPDHLLRQGGKLQRAAATLAGTGHRVHVCLVGVESFSGPELDRMNKGLRPWESLAAVRLLRQLERQHPATFGFREHCGLSTIIFTPWTTLDDLALNLAVARHFGLERLCGKFLTSRLRLYPGLPLTALARRDGLLADAYEDPALDTARRNFYPDEIPWRFRHPEVALVDRIAARLPPSPALDEDPLYRRVQSWAGGTGSPEALLQRAAGLVERVAAAPAPPTVDELLGAAPPPAPGDARERPQDVHRTVRRQLALQRAGLKPVSRLEGLDRATADDVCRRLAGEDRGVRLVARPADLQHEPRFEVFFGRSADEVEEAVHLTDLHHLANDPARLASARQRIGELFGYPPCCAASFAAVECASPSVAEWLILLRRCEQPGAISPLLNPFKLIEYVPCSFSCERSLERAAAALRALDRVLPGGSDPELRSSRQPRLFLLDRPGQHVELVAAEAAGPRLSFASGLVHGADPRLQPLAAGGTLTLRDGAVLVDQGGRRAASFFLTAALFWHEAAFEPELHRLCALEVLAPLRDPREHVAPVGPGPAAGWVTATELARRLRARLLPPGRPPRRCAGMTVQSVEPSSGRHVVVTLARDGGPPEGEDELRIHVEPLAGAAHHFRAVGDLAVSYSEVTPLTAPLRRDALAAFVAQLAARRLSP